MICQVNVLLLNCIIYSLDEIREISLQFTILYAFDRLFGRAETSTMFFFTDFFFRSGHLILPALNRGRRLRPLSRITLSFNMARNEANSVKISHRAFALGGRRPFHCVA